MTITARGRLALLSTASLTFLALLSPQAATARDLFRPEAFSNYKPDLANGEYMMNAAGCAACHSLEDRTLLSGGLKMETFVGTFHAPNISPSPQGIGGGSNADFLNAVMNGVDREGNHLYPVMPYVSYAGMKPEDVLDIKAYIDTLPQSDATTPPHALSFPFNFRSGISVWKRNYFDTPAFQPAGDEQLERGRYLVESVAACGECHTPRTSMFAPDTARKFEGSPSLTGGMAAPPITAAALRGIPDAAITHDTLVEGLNLSGLPMADPTMRRIVAGTARLTVADRHAMLAYLRGEEVPVPADAAATQPPSVETPADAGTVGGKPADAAPAQAGTTPSPTTTTSTATATTTPTDAPAQASQQDVTALQPAQQPSKPSSGTNALGGAGAASAGGAAAAGGQPTLVADQPLQPTAGRPKPTSAVLDTSDIGPDAVCMADEKAAASAPQPAAQPAVEPVTVADNPQPKPPETLDAAALNPSPITGSPAPEPASATTPVAVTPAVARPQAQKLAQSADAFIGQYCRSCHGPGQKSQGSFPAGTLRSIAADAKFVTPGRKEDSRLYTSVASGQMPYGARPSPQEVASLGAWIDSLQQARVASRSLAAPLTVAATELRPIVPWRSLGEAIVRDLGSVTEADREHQRYFTFQAMFNGRMPCESVERYAKRQALYAAGFRKLLNSVSLGNRLVVPTEVAGSDGLVVRVDLRDLRWDARKWDLLVGSYPYGYDPSADTVLKSLADATGTNLPILRIDWLMANALKPEIYHALLELPANIRELETRLGVDVPGNIRRRDVVRAAFGEGSSGVSDHNRMIERHDLPQGGYFWTSYDFAGSKGRQSLYRHPHGPAELEPLEEGLESFHHDGGEMIFSLPNGMQGYYLSTDKGDRLNRGPTTIVSFRNRPIGKGIEIINGRSCVDCHADGIILKRDQLRDYIQASTQFTRQQQDLLLQLYVDQSELQRTYEADRSRFIDALTRIGAVEEAPDGSLKSVSGPGKAEAITYFADLYEQDLDAQALAAEFDMRPEEFSAAVQRVRDPAVGALAREWIAQLDRGTLVPRFEVEENFAALTDPVLGLKALVKTPEQEQAVKDAGVTLAGVTATAAKPEVKVPAYKDPATAGNLKLLVDVKAGDVKVGEKLTFTVNASSVCEMQAFYVEEKGGVETIPQVMIGEATLEPGKPRTIPQPDTGDLVFDTTGQGETLLVFCREGGLGDAKLTADQAKEMARTSGEPKSRGLAIQLAQKHEEAEKAGKDKPGQSAINYFTFNVIEK